MVQRTLNPLFVGIMVFFGILFAGQNCLAQSDLCDSAPCDEIDNAVDGICTPIPGGVCQPGGSYTLAIQKRRMD